MCAARIEAPIKATNLTSELAVAREIYRAQRTLRPLSFDSLVQMAAVKHIGDRYVVSRALDKLFDQGLVRSVWTSESGRSVKVLEIPGEAEDLLHIVDEHTSD